MEFGLFKTLIKAIMNDVVVIAIFKRFTEPENYKL